MTSMTRTSVAMIVLVVLVMAARPVLAGEGGEYVPPRTSFGDPDLEGIWTNATVTPLERPRWTRELVLDEAEAERWERRMRETAERGLEPTDPDAPAPQAGGRIGGYNTFWLDPGTTVARVRGEYRSALVVEPQTGRIPYSEEGRRRMMTQMRELRGTDGPEQRPLGERCIVGYGSTGGPPMLPVLYNNHYQIVQTPEHVLIHIEMNNDARIVRLKGEHREPGLPRWLGESVGHWDGDTLVVETRNLHPDQSLRVGIRNRLYISPQARIIERFTRVGPEKIRYEFEVDDPQVFTQRWRGEIPMHAAEGPIYEYACHEGNYSLPGILSGARQEEAAARAKEEADGD